jgi:hypothetical protein
MPRRPKHDYEKVKGFKHSEVSPFELDVLGELTLFQAQVLRDAFLENTETDEEIARRMDMPEKLVRDFRRCRYKKLIPAEIPIGRGNHLPKVFEIVDSVGVEIPRCARLRIRLSGHVVRQMESEAI